MDGQAAKALLVGYAPESSRLGFSSVSPMTDGRLFVPPKISYRSVLPIMHAVVSRSGIVVLGLSSS